MTNKQHGRSLYKATQLRRRVKGSDEWNNVKGPEVMKKAMLVKFSIPQLALSFRKAGTAIGEATRNKWWGTGKTMSQDSAFESRMWTGANKAGELLMDVRRSLHSDQDIPEATNM